MAALRPFFFEAPTETVGRRPCSHGGGPLRELDGQCPPSPIAGSPVPCSAPSGALRRNTKGMRAPIGPLRIGFRPPPLAPAKGGRWLRTAAAPGLRPAASRHHSAGDPGPRLRWPRAIAACARPSLRRRLGPPLASLRPSGGSDGSGTRSCGSPLGCSGWACVPPYAPLRVRLRPFCAGASAGPPKTAPARRGWSLGPLAPPRRQGYGLRSSRLGPGAALRAAFSGPRPQAFLEDTVRGIKFVREVGSVRKLLRRSAARDSNTALPNTPSEKNGEIHAGAENSEKVPDLTCRICKTFFQVSLPYISLIHICVINRYFYKLS